MRRLLHAGSSGLVLLAMMLVGSLVLWVGVPLLGLYVGSYVQALTESLGLGLGGGMLAALVAVFVIVLVLGWLSDRHADLREARGLEAGGNVALEGILVVSAGVALVIFSYWFFVRAGTSPIPLQSEP